VIVPGDTQTVTGKNFQPGEEVEAFFNGESLGKKKADADGNVEWTFVIPEDLAPGTYSVELVGELSGSVEVEFEVGEPEKTEVTNPPVRKPAKPYPGRGLPFTGADGLVGLSGAALGALLAGWLMLLAKKRRREEEQEPMASS